MWLYSKQGIFLYLACVHARVHVPWVKHLFAYIYSWFNGRSKKINVQRLVISSLSSESPHNPNNPGFLMLAVCANNNKPAINLHKWLNQRPRKIVSFWRGSPFSPPKKLSGFNLKFLQTPAVQLIYGSPVFFLQFQSINLGAGYIWVNIVVCVQT